MSQKRVSSTFNLKSSSTDTDYKIDSLAGQMQAMKTGSAPARKKKKPAAKEVSDEESGTDEEEEDTSETDTDTDEE